MGTESRNVDVMSAKSIRELPVRNTETIVNLKVGRYGGENG